MSESLGATSTPTTDDTGAPSGQGHSDETVAHSSAVTAQQPSAPDNDAETSSAASVLTPLNDEETQSLQDEG